MFWENIFYALKLPRYKVYKWYIKIINEIIIIGFITRGMKTKGAYDSTRERGPRGEYSWLVIQPTFLNLLSLCITC
jgi:hypothetical protein